MKETSFEFTESLDDELLPEYDLDYSKVKPNRFAKRDREWVEAEQSFEVMRSYAARVDYAAFDKMMARVPDVPPMPGDEL